MSFRHILYILPKKSEIEKTTSTIVFPVGYHLESGSERTPIRLLQGWDSFRNVKTFGAPVSAALEGVTDRPVNVPGLSGPDLSGRHIGRAGE